MRLAVSHPLPAPVSPVFASPLMDIPLFKGAVWNGELIYSFADADDLPRVSIAEEMAGIDTLTGVFSVSAVERYQSFLLMPDWLIHDAVRDIDVTHWPALYDLAAAARVTISNLVVRLVRLNIIYIPDGTHDLYAGMDAYTGQRHLF